MLPPCEMPASEKAEYLLRSCTIRRLIVWGFLSSIQPTRELYVCDIATLLKVKGAIVSHHLRELRNLKILQYRNDGKLTCYSLRDRRVSEILNYSLKQLVDQGF
ncbi:MAG: ArsR family transcriptional regulator [Cyanobacteria bacterium P01_A01_bin.17]